MESFFFIFFTFYFYSYFDFRSEREDEHENFPNFKIVDGGRVCVHKFIEKGNFLEKVNVDFYFKNKPSLYLRLRCEKYTGTCVFLWNESFKWKFEFYEENASLRLKVKMWVSSQHSKLRNKQRFQNCHYNFKSECKSQIKTQSFQIKIQVWSQHPYFKNKMGISK